MTNEELMKELEKANENIKVLQNHLARLERTMPSSITLPNSMVFSPMFLKRAFAIYGHVLVAGFILAFPIYCLMFALTLLGLW